MLKIWNRRNRIKEANNTIGNLVKQLDISCVGYGNLDMLEAM